MNTQIGSESETRRWKKICDRDLIDDWGRHKNALAGLAIRDAQVSNPTGTGLTQNRWAGINDLENDSCRLNYMNDQ